MAKSAEKIIEESKKPPFSTFYNEELLPKLQELEAERKSIKNTLIYPTLGLGSLATFLILILPNLGIQSFILTAITGTGLWVWFRSKASREYRYKFKAEIIGKILRYIDKDYRYSAGGRIDRNEFVGTRIFNRVPDRYRGEDLIMGKNDQTEFSFSEVTAEYYVRDQDNRRTLKTLFRGIVFKADFNKEFKHRTVILPDVGEKYLGSIGKALQKLNFTRSGNVEMENADFEKEFIVYADDDQEARYLLSPSFMEKLLTCKERLDVDISLSFYKSNLYIMIPVMKDLFEPSIFKTIIHKERTEEYYYDMMMVLDIVDELGLNTRIWSKMPEFEEEEKRNNNNSRFRGRRFV